MNDTDAARLQWLARRSVEIIRAGQSASGAYVASPSFAAYRFCWLRDGAFVADAMSRIGETTSAAAFLDWCARVIVDRRDRIRALLEDERAGRTIPLEVFPHARFTVDGREVPGEWGTFQLDGYGTWVWALDRHLRRYDLSAEPFAEALGLTAAYLAAFADRPCFDWWEENPEHRHVSTIAAVIAGLEVAVGRPEVPAAIRERSAAVAADLRATVRRDAGRLGRLAKWIGSDSIDASLVAVSTPFGILEPDDPLMEATVAAVERDLVRDGAVHRYPGDRYYGGGGWPVLAGFLGWHRLRSGRPADARVELDWIATLAAADGELPEQDRNRLLIPEAEAAWIDRWGPSACPLLWSHAMYLALAAELGVFGPDGEAAGRTTSAD